MHRPIVALVILVATAAPGACAADPDHRAAGLRTTTVADGIHPSLVTGFIVKYQDESPAAHGDVPAATALLPDPSTIRDVLSGIWIERPMGLGRMVVQTDPAPSTLDEPRLRLVMEALAGPAAVESVEPDLLVVPYENPAPASSAQQPRWWPYQWSLHQPDGTNPSAIDVLAAWNDGVTGRGVRVAVIDTGVVPDHPELGPRLAPGRTFLGPMAKARPDVNVRRAQPDAGGQDLGTWTRMGDCDPARNLPDSDSASSWHGTQVAGIVATSGIDLMSVAPGATIVPVRVLGPCGGRTSDTVDGILWSAGLLTVGTQRVDVINLSLGTPGRVNTVPVDLDCAQVLVEALRGAIAAGVFVAVAAGNDNVEASRVQPANCGVADQVVVAAFTRDGTRADYSNFGPTVSVSAPGGSNDSGAHQVLSIVNSGQLTAEPYRRNTAGWYGGKTGTSMATPHVAGLAALLIEHWLLEPPVTPHRIAAAVTTRVRAVPAGECAGNKTCGSGLIDAPLALGVSPSTPN